MKKNSTELVFILDKSGSMHGLEADTIGGFNSVIDEQKKQDGEVLVTTVLFSNSSEKIHDRVDIAKIGKMTDKDYVTGGCTALLDAVGETIEHIETVHKYVRAEDVPEKTMFVITTDGMENASRKYQGYQVRKMIEAKKEQGWNFIFLASNIDAAETAEYLGVGAENSAQFEASAAGSRKMFAKACAEISDFRSK
ncbi:MAG: hypothetical protein J5879_04155 [Clostridia bacterium]|nr:hypothetical protein [Clostridia bacterium]